MATDSDQQACLGCGYRPEKVTKLCVKCLTKWGELPSRPIPPEKMWVDPATLPLPPIVVREYTTHKAFEGDAATMTARGYSVLSVNEKSQNAGCLRILTLGLLSLVVRPESHIVVTYQKQA